MSVGNDRRGLSLRHSMESRSTARVSRSARRRSTRGGTFYSRGRRDIPAAGCGLLVVVMQEDLLHHNNKFLITPAIFMIQQQVFAVLFAGAEGVVARRRVMLMIVLLVVVHPRSGDAKAPTTLVPAGVPVLGGRGGRNDPRRGRGGALTFYSVRPVLDKVACLLPAVEGSCCLPAIEERIVLVVFVERRGRSGVVFVEFVFEELVVLVVFVERRGRSGVVDGGDVGAEGVVSYDRRRVVVVLVIVVMRHVCSLNGGIEEILTTIKGVDVVEWIVACERIVRVVPRHDRDVFILLAKCLNMWLGA